MPAKSQRGVPIPRACGSHEPRAWHHPQLKLYSKICGKPWPRLVFVLISRPKSILLINQAVRDGRIGVDAAVAQEWPVAANVFQRFQIDVADQDFLTVVRGFGEHAAEWIAEK